MNIELLRRGYFNLQLFNIQLTLFQFHAQQIKPDAISRCDELLHLAYARLAVGRVGGEGGMFLTMILIYIAHHRLDGLGMPLGIVVELAESPRGAVVECYTIAVHEIDAARHVVVVASVGIHGTVGLHHPPHPLAEVGGLGRPSGTLAPASPLRVEREVHLDALCHGMVLSLGVPRQSA